MVYTSNGMVGATLRINDPTRPELDIESLRQESFRAEEIAFAKASNALIREMVEEGILPGRAPKAIDYRVGNMVVTFPVVTSAEEFRAFFDEKLNPALYHRESQLESMPYLAGACFKLCRKWADRWVGAMMFGMPQTKREQADLADSLAMEWHDEALENILRVVANTHRISKGVNKGLCPIEVWLRNGNGKFPIMFLIGKACFDASRTARNKRFARREDSLAEGHEGIVARFEFHCEGIEGWVESVSRKASAAKNDKAGKLAQDSWRMLHLLLFADHLQGDKVMADGSKKEAYCMHSLQISRGKYRECRAELQQSFFSWFRDPAHAERLNAKVKVSLLKSLGFKVPTDLAKLAGE